MSFGKAKKERNYESRLERKKRRGRKRYGERGRREEGEECNKKKIIKNTFEREEK